MTPRIFRTAVPNLSASEITNIKKTKTIFSNTSKNTSEYSVTRGADNNDNSSCKTLFRTNGHRALLDITKGKYYYSNSDFDKALDYYENALASNPKRLESPIKSLMSICSPEISETPITNVLLNNASLR